jgi:drug/metabolite transporter (DMT)-like permease
MLKKYSNNIQGVFYLILACLMVSILIAIVRKLAGEVNVSVIVMLRNAFSLLIMVPLIIKERSLIFRPKRPMLNLVRSLNGFVSMSIWFYAVTLVPLSEAVAISFIVPSLTTLIAILFLKEKIESNKIISLIIGFIGMLIILRPGFKSFNQAYLLIFLAAFCWAISNLLTKILSEFQKPSHLVVYLSAVMFVVSIPFGIGNFHSITYQQIFWLFILGGVSNLSYFFTSLAYSKTSLSNLQPYDFMRLVFTVIIGIIFFNEKLDWLIVFGAMLITFGGVIAIPKKTKKYH